MAKEQSSKRSGKKSRRELEEALRRHVRARGAEYLKDPNVTSVGIGLKNGDGPMCLQFTVGTKIEAESEIEALGSRRIPETIMVDGEAIPTDVLQRDFRPAFDLVEEESLSDRKVRTDPIRPGVSAAHFKASAGTIGLIVFDRATGAPCVLSNWHVLHGNKGDIGDEVVQPGPFDDNNVAGNFAGNLLRSHLGAAGDCALARIRGREFDRKVIDFDVVPKRMARVALGDVVMKSGRTTGVTYGRVRRVDVMAKINYEFPAGERTIGCFEIGVDPAHPPANGEVSMPGDSGAPWVIADKKGKPTDIFAGLHFAGETRSSTDEHALACYPLSVQKKLDFLLEPPATHALPDDQLELAVARTGYDADFLGVRVALPVLSLSLKRDAVNFGRAQTIPYTHFEVCLSAKRRLARYVAWNIDGARKVTQPRRGFKLDPRIEPRFQHGEELYASNPLDRGHIARRADLCWGTIAEADQANRDSFFFTNIAPQHERFNQSSRSGLWGELENLVLEQADAQDIRVSVFGGPIFTDEDVEYRCAQIPRSFWKLIAYRGGDGRLRVSTFVLSQADLLHDLETLDLDPFRIYQVTVSDIMTRTLLDFSALDEADVMARPEMATSPATTEALRDPTLRVAEIRSPEDLRL